MKRVENRLIPRSTACPWVRYNVEATIASAAFLRGRVRIAPQKKTVRIAPRGFNEEGGR